MTVALLDRWCVDTVDTTGATKTGLRYGVECAVAEARLWRNDDGTVLVHGSWGNVEVVRRWGCGRPVVTH